MILKIFYFTGARKSEIWRLKWEDVDFKASRIILRTKKRAGGHMEYDYIPMVSDLREVLLRWKDDQPMPKEHLFTNMTKQSVGYGKPFVDRINFMRRVCKLAEVKYFGFHAIRHLTATELFHAVHPVSVIQKMLRHKNPNTTARYLHDLGLDRALDALEGTF